MKPNEIRELEPEAIRQRIQEEEAELQQLRFQHAVATLPSPSVIRHKRRLIARLQTVLREKESASV